jgi:hypothetical protein
MAPVGLYSRLKAYYTGEKGMQLHQHLDSNHPNKFRTRTSNHYHSCSSRPCKLPYSQTNNVTNLMIDRIYPNLCATFLSFLYHPALSNTVPRCSFCNPRSNPLRHVLLYNLLHIHLCIPYLYQKWQPSTIASQNGLLPYWMGRDREDSGLDCYPIPWAFI